MRPTAKRLGNLAQACDALWLPWGPRVADRSYPDGVMTFPELAELGNRRNPVGVYTSQLFSPG